MPPISDEVPAFEMKPARSSFNEREGRRQEEGRRCSSSLQYSLLGQCICFCKQVDLCLRIRDAVKKGYAKVVVAIGICLSLKAQGCFLAPDLEIYRGNLTSRKGSGEADWNRR